MALNKVILIGNLTADPELKQTPNGVSLCNFSLAVNRSYSKQGEQGVDYINICAWRSTAEFVSRYAKKGSALAICGKLQTRNYTNGQGQKVYITEVVADEVSFAGNKNDNGGQTRANGANGNYNGYIPNAYGGNNSGFEPIEIPEDSSLPF